MHPSTEDTDTGVSMDGWGVNHKRVEPIWKREGLFGSTFGSYAYEAITMTPIGDAYDTIAQYNTGQLSLAAAGGLLALSVIPGGSFAKKAYKAGTGPYSLVRGHHVHAKAAFKNVASYDPKKGFSLSHHFMKENGLKHSVMTSYQRQAFKELAQSGRSNTLKEHTRIAVEALQAGGASQELARDLVAQSLKELRKSGVRAPSNIPWYK